MITTEGRAVWTAFLWSRVARLDRLGFMQLVLDVVELLPVGCVR